MPRAGALADAAAAAALGTAEGARLLADRLLPGRAVPATAADLTPAFLERALARAFPGAAVRGVHPIDAQRGTTDRVRLGLDAAGGAPSSVFVKLAPREAGTRLFVGALGLGAREVRFYRALRPGLAVRAPRAWWTGSDPATGRFALVLEDVIAAGGAFRDVGAPCSAAEARAVLVELARLHAWRPAGGDAPAWLAPSGGARARTERFVRERLAARAVRRFGDLLPAPLRDADALLARAWPALERGWREDGGALLHGDPHLGNVYWRGGAPGLADWQVVQRGDPLRDVAYFLVLSLDPDTRRAHEAELLEGWGDALADAGAAAPDPDAARRRYRRGTLYALAAALVTLGAGGLQPGPVVRAGLARSAAAVLDHDAHRIPS